jgi:hypothetical protein
MHYISLGGKYTTWGPIMHYIKGGNEEKIHHRQGQLRACIHPQKRCVDVLLGLVSPRWSANESHVSRPPSDAWSMTLVIWDFSRSTPYFSYSGLIRVVRDSSGSNLYYMSVFWSSSALTLFWFNKREWWNMHVQGEILTGSVSLENDRFLKCR